MPPPTEAHLQQWLTRLVSSTTCSDPQRSRAQVGSCVGMRVENGGRSMLIGRHHGKAAVEAAHGDSALQLGASQGNSSEAGQVCTIEMFPLPHPTSDSLVCGSAIFSMVTTPFSCSMAAPPLPPYL